MSWEMPEVGQPWPGTNRVRCCEEDWGGSHYHCGECGEVTGMYGHYVTLTDEHPWMVKRAQEIGVELPFSGHACNPESTSTLLAVTP